MSNLSDYTPDQVEKMMTAPMLIGMYIMGASLSGPVGLVREMMAAVESALEAGKAAAPGSLFSELWSEENLRAKQAQIQQETQDTTRDSKDMEQARGLMLDDVRAAVAALAERGTPTEVAAYKQLLREVAERVANAAKEGGFMGVGGVLVNDAEKKALEVLATALAN